MNRKTALFALYGLSLFLLSACGAAVAIEEPTYTATRQDGAFEIRTYGPKIVAETWIAGSLSSASSAGFRKVAGYIFGRNRTQAGATTKIDMTAPVTVAKSEKIDMTAPVMTHPMDGGYRLQFVMPSRYTLATLPAPIDNDVHLREVPSATYAVVRFSGLCGESKVAERTAALRAWITKNGLTVLGEAELARYDPPWRLPFLRRNEVLIPIRAF